MSRSTPKNLVKKIQIATDRKFKCGQIPFGSNNPFCICWQEPASVFRFNILSVAEEPLRRSVAGKGSKRRQSQLCKMCKWAHVRLPPPSKTCDARGELSEVQTWFTSGRNKSHLSLRLSWSFPNSSLRLQLPGELDGTLWSLLLLPGWRGFSPWCSSAWLCVTVLALSWQNQELAEKCLSWGVRTHATRRLYWHHTVKLLRETR